LYFDNANGLSAFGKGDNCKLSGQSDLFGEMELLTEMDLSPEEAIQMMTDFAMDPFLTDRDPDRARSVQRVSASLALTGVEIDSNVAAESRVHRKRHRRPKDS
jgi:hypothetical protein